MAALENVFSITFPIFLIIALGFGSTRGGLTNAENIRGIGVFVVRFALPALIFRALSQRPLDEFLDLSYLLAYGGGSLISFAVLFGFTRLAQQRGVAQSALSGMGAGLSNSGFVGFGVAAIAFGPGVITPLALTMIIENLVMLPLGLGLAESEARREAPLGDILFYVLRRLTTNPMILSILAGGAASALHLHLPPPLFRAVDLLANASTAAALFAVGGALAGLSTAGSAGLGFSRLDVARIVAAKLLLHPLAVAALALCFTLPPELKKPMLIFAASPCMSILPILGHPYGFERQGAAALLGATVMSFFTLSAMLALL